MARNYYLLLGIPPDADQARIKTVYRSLAKRFHPDANQGSETAAELFRQINEAYRILSNPKAREKYDRTLKAEEQLRRPQESAAPSPGGGEPEEKFNRFLNSLLDALFGPPERSPNAETTLKRTAPKPKTAVKKRRKPAFSFYFHLAMESQNTLYQRGQDGIYRSAPKARNGSAPRGGFGRVPGVGVLPLLLTALLSFLRA